MIGPKCVTECAGVVNGEALVIENGECDASLMCSYQIT